MRILIADDDKFSQKLLARIVEKSGKCEVVDNGLKAVNAVVKAYDNNIPFDVLFLDIMMPNLDGQDVLAKIREEEEKRGILDKDSLKIIMVTAIDSDESILNAFRSGVEAYLTKPITQEKVLAQLNKLKEEHSNN